MRESLLPRHFLNLAWGSHPRWKKTINIAAHTQFKSWPNPDSNHVCPTECKISGRPMQPPPNDTRKNKKNTHYKTKKKSTLEPCIKDVYMYFDSLAAI